MINTDCAKVREQDKVFNQVEYQVYEQVYEQVGDQTLFQMWHKVNNRLCVRCSND